MRLFLSGVIAIVGSFLIYMMAKYIQKDFDNYRSFKYDLIASSSIIFVSTYLAFSVGPFLAEMAKYRARYPALWGL